MKPINEADWLSRLNINISSNSNRIFNNGYQQLEISVGLTPRNGQTITDDQLNSVRLVTLEDDGSYQELSGEYRYSQERDIRFEYYADTGSPPAPLLESTTLRKRFYVASTASGGSQKVIYAAITKSPDEHYVSHTSTFNSSVTIETVTRLRRQRSDFKLEVVDELTDSVMDTIEHRGGTYEGPTAVDVDVYFLEFKNPAFRIVAVDTPVNGYACYYADSTDDTRLYEIGHHLARVNKILAHYLIDPSAADSTFKYRHISVPMNTRYGALNLVRLNLRGAGADLKEKFWAASEFAVLDQYGNESPISMMQTSGGERIDFKMDY